MPIITSTIFPWAELHNDYQQPISEGGITYPSITHYICAMTQLTGVAIRYIINEPITPKAIEVAHLHYTNELNQTETRSILKFYAHAIQQNQLFSDTLESVMHNHIAYECSSAEYPYVNPEKTIQYNTDEGPGLNLIGSLLQQVSDYYLYRPESHRYEVTQVSDDNILSPLYVYQYPVVIDGKPYYSALEYSFANLFNLLQTSVHVPLIPYDMLMEFRSMEKKRLERIVKQLLPKAIRQKFDTINTRRLLLTVYTLGDVDYEITYTENYLPNSIIATITSGVHSSIATKIIDGNERCRDDINCVYSGRLIRPYSLLQPELSDFTHKWVVRKMKRLLEVFNGVVEPILKYVHNAPFLLNSFINTMYTSCSFIRFSESLVDNVPIEILRELRSHLQRKEGYSTLEQTILYDHNLFLYILWSYGSYLVTWLEIDYPDQSPQSVLDRIHDELPVFDQNERRQAMAQCIKQLLDFYNQIQYRVTQDEIRRNALMVFGVEDEEDYYFSDLDFGLISRIQFYMPIRNRSEDDVHVLLDLVGVPHSVKYAKQSVTPSPDKMAELLEIVDPSELNKPVRRLRRRGH